MRCVTCNSKADVQITFPVTYRELKGTLSNLELQPFCFYCLEKLSKIYNEMLQKGLVK